MTNIDGLRAVVLGSVIRGNGRPSVRGLPRANGWVVAEVLGPGVSNRPGEARQRGSHAGLQRVVVVTAHDSQHWRGGDAEVIRRGVKGQAGSALSQIGPIFFERHPGIDLLGTDV